MLGPRESAILCEPEPVKVRLLEGLQKARDESQSAEPHNGLLARLTLNLTNFELSKQTSDSSGTCRQDLGQSLKCAPQKSTDKMNHNLCTLEGENIDNIDSKRESYDQNYKLWPLDTYLRSITNGKREKKDERRSAIHHASQLIS